MSVFPSDFKLTEEPMISCAVRLSRLPLGSSAKRTSGRPTSARADRHALRWPPDNSLGLVIQAAAPSPSASGPRSLLLFAPPREAAIDARLRHVSIADMRGIM